CGVFRLHAPPRNRQGAAMNRFTDNLTDPDFWLRLIYTLLFALAWQVVELLLAVILVLQIGFRLFSGKPSVELAGFGNSLSQYAWQMGRYVTGASEVKPWPFLARQAAGAKWKPRPPAGPVTVEPVAPAAAPQTAAPTQADPVGEVVQPEPPLVHPLPEDEQDEPGAEDRPAS